MGCGRWLRIGPLDSVALEEVIFFAAGALGALEAAHQQNCDSYRDQDGQEIGIQHQPMSKDPHMLLGNVPPVERTRHSTTVTC